MTETAIAERKRGRYTTAEIERGLTELAACNGNSRAAEENLREAGMRIDHATLWQWQRKTYPDRYEEIRADQLPRIREQAADEHMALAAQQMEVNGLVLKRLKDNVNELAPRDLPGAVRNLSVSAAVETEKAQLLNDQPTSRVASDLPGLLKEIKSMGVDPEVVLEAEVVSEEDVTESDEQEGLEIGPAEPTAEDAQTRMSA